VVNAPGAGSMVATNQVYNTLPKDGTTIGAINRGIPFEPLLGQSGAQFDPLKMQYLGSPDQDTAVCAARPDSGIKSVEDLKSHELIVGGTGPGADTAMIPALLREVLGLKFKVVSGYPGSRDILLASERNEVQGICVNYDSLSREATYRSGVLNIILQAASNSDPRLKEFPLARDLAKTDAERQALDLFFQRAAIGRPFIAAAAVPPERLAALREAFIATLADPQLRQEAEAVGLNVRPVSGPQMTGIIEAVYRTPGEVVTRMKGIFGRAP
jgi:tripartite-type tricarboxylate transporter receptor subunit TctC